MCLSPMTGVEDSNCSGTSLDRSTSNVPGGLPANRTQSEFRVFDVACGGRGQDYLRIGDDTGTTRDNKQIAVRGRLQ